MNTIISTHMPLLDLQVQCLHFPTHLASSREREQLELEVEKISLSRDFVDVDENGNPKKKLRLTKEQSAVLEDSFKEHYTISPVCYISKLINK